MPNSQSKRKVSQHRNFYIIASGVLFALLSALSFFLFLTFENIYAQRLSLLWTIVALIFVHDAYFYWAHRWLHTKFMLRFHRIHHMERDTTMTSAWVMHPVESVLEAAFFPLAALLPIDPLGLVAFGGVVFLVNTIGHYGSEVYPKWFLNSLAGKVLTTATHHSLHHTEVRANYGAYFRFWDVVCKTESKEYLKNLRRK